MKYLYTMKLLELLRWIRSAPLNSNRKLNATIFFFRWQLKTFIVRKEFIYSWLNNIEFRVRKGESGLTGNMYCGLMEFEEMSFVLHYLRPEDTFIDIGANSGSYSLLAGKGVGCKVIAFEPIPATYIRLLRNIELNNLIDVVDARKKALGSRNKRGFLTADEDTMNHYVLDPLTESRTVSVEISTLDQELSTFPSLLKIDVEGFELEVLKGAKKTLSHENLNAIIVEVNGSGEKYGFENQMVIDILEKFRFNAYEYHPFERKLTQRHLSTNSWGNLIFIRDIEVALLRLKKGNKFEIFDQTI